MEMCTDMPYKEVALPTVTGENSQEDASMEIQQFAPLVSLQCSEYLKFFLCLMYAPPCVPQAEG